MKTLISAMVCASLFFCGVSFLADGSAYKASAEEAELSLFLPTSYEQYLALNSPSDAAMNEHYIVIADGCYLYIYDRAGKEYVCFPHSNYNGLPSGITKVQFDLNGRLFFSDEDTGLYIYDFDRGEQVIQTNIPSSTFLIQGDTLYTATSTGTGSITIKLSAYSCRNQELIFLQDIDTLTSTVAPCLASSENTLYCAIDDTVYTYTFNGSVYERVRRFLAGNATTFSKLSSLYVFNNKIYFTVNGSREQDGLYRAELDNSAKLLLEGSGFISLFSYSDVLYCVEGASVRAMEVADDSAAFTGYEISEKSDAFNRQSNADETVLGGNLLVTADCGNNRILIYDRQTAEYSSIGLEGVPSCVATDGETIAVGVENTVYAYRYGENEPYDSRTMQSTVRGVSCIFGTVYFVTMNFAHGALGTNAAPIHGTSAPVALTSDVWGNLYVGYENGTVFRFTETEFLGEGSNGTQVAADWQLPADFRSLRADFDGNLYYLSANGLYCNGNAIATIDGNDLVYRGENAESVSPVSFALGYEDGGVYFQFGNYAAYCEISIPTLSAIPTNHAYGEVFSVPSLSELTYVDVQANATGIRVDLSSLTEESEYYDYLEYVRIEGGRGVLLATSGKYAIVALYGNYGYTLGLYLAENCTEVPPEIAEASGETRYTSNEIPLSYYPCLTPSLTETTLSRATQLTLLAEVKDGVGFPFAFVSYSQDGKTLFGYVPYAYLAVTSPVSGNYDEYRLGYLKANENGVVFEDASGRTVTVTERIAVKVYDTDTRSYLVQFEEDGCVYSAQVTGDMLEALDSDILRTSLIIVLCVMAVGIITGYVLLVPRRRK